MRKEKKKAINFYLSFNCSRPEPWSALNDTDKIYYYKEADVFDNDKQLSDYINLVRSSREEL